MAFRGTTMRSVVYSTIVVIDNVVIDFRSLRRTAFVRGMWSTTRTRKHTVTCVSVRTNTDSIHLIQGGVGNRKANS